MAESQAINMEEVQRGKDPIVKTLVRVFWILLIVTVIEVTLALLHFYLHFLPRPLLNGLFILMTLVKAFYIVAEFMHFKHEVKQLVMIILIPLFFLIWGITATLWEGGATKNARNRVQNIIESVSPWEMINNNNK